MYIHTIRSGSKQQYTKRLLRISRRENGRVVNRTIANVSGWADEQVARVREALAAHRAWTKAGFGEPSARRLLTLLLREGVAPWRLM